MTSEIWIIVGFGGVVPMMLYLVPLTIIAHRMGRGGLLLFAPWVAALALTPVVHATSALPRNEIAGWSQSVAQATRLSLLISLAGLALVGMRRRTSSVAEAFA